MQSQEYDNGVKEIISEHQHLAYLLRIKRAIREACPRNRHGIPDNCVRCFWVDKQGRFIIVDRPRQNIHEVLFKHNQRVWSDYRYVEHPAIRQQVRRKRANERFNNRIRRLRILQAAIVDGQVRKRVANRRREQRVLQDLFPPELMAPKPDPKPMPQPPVLKPVLQPAPQPVDPTPQEELQEQSWWNQDLEPSFPDVEEFNNLDGLLWEEPQQLAQPAPQEELQEQPPQQLPQQPPQDRPAYMDAKLEWDEEWSINDDNLDFE